MTYTVGSLFAGIGGIDLGFERAGFTTAWQVECNEYCRKVLAKNFPHADRSVTDVRDAGQHNLKPVDVIVGGFPCQDISNAGLRAGIEGERSGLWSEYARIVRELRPKYVLVENVAALLGRGMGRVLGDLAEIGYDAEWEIISAADVGAPHLRERVWILAYAVQCSRCTQFGKQQKEWTAVTDSGGSRDVAHPERMRELQPQRREQDERRRTSYSGEKLADSVSFGQQRPRQPFNACYSTQDGQRKAGDAFNVCVSSFWAVEPSVGRVAHGVPSRVDRLRGLGNAVVPEIPYQIALRIQSSLEAA